MSKINALNNLEEILSKYLNFEKTPKKDALWLQNMEMICKELSHPENSYKSIHVAGSKGKGSTSSFIASILEEARFSTGLFTSPHISDISERVRKPSGVFSNDVYEKALEKLKKLQDFIDALENNGGNKATWFELFTIYSFLCFQEANVDWAVFEVGLGGRLDSTNVITPEACVITPIELEHVEFLGDTIEKIAGEKAGIIKKGIPVFSAPQCENAKKVFIEKANEVETTITFLDENDSKLLSLFNQIDSIDLKLKGRIQKQNAKLASLVIKTILPEIKESIILKGLAKATMPCRFEILEKIIDGKKLTIVLDGCHTPNSMNLCLDTFYKEFGENQELLFACASDKDVEEIANCIANSKCNFSHISITEPGGIKPGDFERTIKAFETTNDKTILYKNNNYSECIHYAIVNALANDTTLICAGSFYLCAELLAQLDTY